MWQPIETAPKDRTYILLGWFLEHGGGGPPAVSYWRSDKQMWLSGDKFLKSEGYFSPTHWFELPPDPREGKGQKMKNQTEAENAEIRRIRKEEKKFAWTDEEVKSPNSYLRFRVRPSEEPENGFILEQVTKTRGVKINPETDVKTLAVLSPEAYYAIELLYICAFESGE